MPGEGKVAVGRRQHRLVEAHAGALAARAPAGEGAFQRDMRIALHQEENLATLRPHLPHQRRQPIERSCQVTAGAARILLVQLVAVGQRALQLAIQREAEQRQQYGGDAGDDVAGHPPPAPPKAR